MAFLQLSQALGLLLRALGRSKGGNSSGSPEFKLAQLVSGTIVFSLLLPALCEFFTIFSALIPFKGLEGIVCVAWEDFVLALEAVSAPTPRFRLLCSLTKQMIFSQFLPKPFAWLESYLARVAEHCLVE